MQVQSAQKHLTVSEAAAKLGVSAATLRRWEREGRYTPHRTLGNQRYFALEDIEALAQGKPFHHQNGSTVSKDDKPLQSTPAPVQVPQESQPSRYLNLGEAANFLGVAPSQLRLWEAQGKISPIYTLSGCRQYGLDGLKKLAQPQEDKAATPAAAIPQPSAEIPIPLALATPPPSFPVVRLSLTIALILFASFGLLAGSIFVASRFSPSSLVENVKGELARALFGEGMVSPTPTIIEQTKQALITDYLKVRDGNKVDYKVFFAEGIEVGTDTLTIDDKGALTTSEPITTTDTSVSSLEIGGGMIAGTGNVYIIDRSGRIPALTSTYIADLDATSLTGKIDNADHLDGIDSASFLRSNESDTAEGAINFTAQPGGNGVGGGPVYVNPGGATANYTLFGVALNTSQRFKVDAEGDTSIAGTLDATGATTLGGTLAVTGNATLSGDLAINGGDLTTSATSFNLVNSTATTLNIGGAATTVGIGASTGTTTVNNNLSVTGTASFTGDTAVLSSGQLTLTRNPTLAHTGTWAIGSSTWNASNATIYANPASPTADSNIFALAKNSSVQFAVDAEGDIYGNNLILTGSTTTASTTVGTLSVEGNTTLGDAPGDTLTVNPATFTWQGGDKTLDLTGTATRTLTLLNSTASQVADLDLSDGDLKLGGTVRISNAGAGTLTTLDTGQGAYELYAMDQNVLIASTPTFAQLTIDNTVFNADALTVTGTLLFDASVQTTVDTASTIASAAGATLDAFQVQGDTVTISGVTNITTATGFNLVDIKAPTYSNASIAVSNAATLYVAGAPSASGGMTITSPYALWIDAGVSRLDGDVTLGGAISGGTTFSGSGNINTTGGALQTNSVTRIDNSGIGSLASLTLTTDLPVSEGGTGASTFTDAGVLLGNTTGAIQVTTAGTSGQVLTSNGAGVDPTFQAAAGGLKVPTAFTAALSNGF